MSNENTHSIPITNESLWQTDFARAERLAFLRHTQTMTDRELRHERLLACTRRFRQILRAPLGLFANAQINARHSRQFD